MGTAPITCAPLVTDLAHFVRMFHVLDDSTHVKPLLAMMAWRRLRNVLAFVIARDNALVWEMVAIKTMASLLARLLVCDKIRLHLNKK